MQTLELTAKELKQGDKVKGGNLWVDVEDVTEVPARGKISICYSVDGAKATTKDYDPDEVFTVRRKDEDTEEGEVE